MRRIEYRKRTIDVAIEKKIFVFESVFEWEKRRNEEGRVLFLGMRLRDYSANASRCHKLDIASLCREQGSSEFGGRGRVKWSRQGREKTKGLLAHKECIEERRLLQALSFYRWGEEESRGCITIRRPVAWSSFRRL